MVDIKFDWLLNRKTTPPDRDSDSKGSCLCPYNVCNPSTTDKCIRTPKFSQEITDIRYDTLIQKFVENLYGNLYFGSRKYLIKQ